MSEIQWLCRCVFAEFLGIDVVVQPSDADSYTLQGGGRRLTMPDRFLAFLDGHPREALIPELPLQTLKPDANELAATGMDDPLPILFGFGEIKQSTTGIETGFDVFGTIFFLLSRFEELVVPVRDKHDRFPASASLAARAGFLDRPIVDEYVDLLWRWIRVLWPQLSRSRRRGDVVVTCDVDTPFDCARSSARQFVRAIGGDLLKRRDLSKTWQRASGYYTYLKGQHECDDNYTFEWYMKQCERHGRNIKFFFIPDGTAGSIDGCYKLKDRGISELIRKVSERKHELGVHGSYNSFNDRRQIDVERSKFMDVCAELGISAPIRGNRQHYLRWDLLKTPDFLDEAGFEYDTTGGYADRAGFRYGTSHPFTMWSWRKRAPLRIKQRPLILMETSLFSQQYMGMDHSGESLEYALTLKERAMQHGGDFVFLWHNSSLKTEQDRAFFKELLQ